MEAPGPTSPITATMVSLAIDQVAGQVIEALRRRGIRPVLLKGASFARWLYDDGHARTYSDIDLLVAPDEVEGAQAVLAEIGYVQRCPGAAPGEQAHHAANWDRPGSPAIDLHNTLSPRVGVSSHECWAVVAASTEATTVGGARVEVLTVPALAVHVVLHAETGRTKTLDDLARAIARVSLPQWRQAREIAARLDALGGLGLGLRLLPEGAALAEALELPRNRSVELQLQASSSGRLARPFEQVAGAAGVRGKARVIFREIVPTPSFVRLWFPPARRGRAWLVVGYLYRLAWVPWRAPLGLQAWRRARRAVAGGEAANADAHASLH